MTGESGDCKVNPNNQSRERSGRTREYRARAGNPRGLGQREREVDEISPELQCVHYGPSRQLS